MLNSPGYLFHSLRHRERDSREEPNLGIETHSLGKNVDKVFCARWLNDSTVLLGTKCGKLFQSDAVTCNEIQVGSVCERPLPIRFIVATEQEIVCSSRMNGNCISFSHHNSDTGREPWHSSDIPVCEGGLVLSGTFHNGNFLFGTSNGSVCWGQRNDGQFCFSSAAVSAEEVRQIVPIPNCNSTFLLLGYSQLISLDLETAVGETCINYPKDYLANLECIAANESKMFVGSRGGIASMDLRVSSLPVPIWSARSCPELDPLHRIMGPTSMVATGDHHLTAGLASGQVMLFEERMNRFCSLLIDFSLIHDFAAVFALDYAHSYGSLAVAGGPYFEEFFGNFFAYVQ